MIAAIHAYCETHGLDLDWLDFTQASSQDLDVLARELMFYGVCAFPEPGTPMLRLASSS